MSHVRLARSGVHGIRTYVAGEVSPSGPPWRTNDTKGAPPRTGSGPVARNTCARAAPGVAASKSPARTQALDPDRRELSREVLLERQLLLDDIVLEERVLHHAERGDVDAAVHREERAGDPVGAQDRLGRPAELLRADLGGVPRALAHELERGEQCPQAPADRVGLVLDGVLRRVLDLADPFSGDRVEAEQHLGLALELGDGAPVAPYVGGDLPARQRCELGVEAAEADDLHVLVRVPAFLLGQHAREDPRRRTDARDADRLALEARDRRDVGRDVEGEVVALGMGRDHLDRRARFAEDEDVGAPGDADQHVAAHDRLEEVRAPTEGDELGLEALAREESALERHDDRPRHRVVAEHGRADLHGGPAPRRPWRSGGRDRGDRAEEATAGDRGRADLWNTRGRSASRSRRRGESEIESPAVRGEPVKGHGHEPVSLTFARAFHTLGRAFHGHRLRHTHRPRSYIVVSRFHNPAPEPPVTYAVGEGIAWITLNRPAMLNALNTELAAALAEHAEAAAADPAVTLVVVRGAGPRARRRARPGQGARAAQRRREPGGGARHRPRQLGVPGRRPRPHAPVDRRQGARRLADRGRAHEAAPPRVLPPRSAGCDRRPGAGAERVHGLVGDRRGQPRVDGEAGGGLLPPAEAMSPYILETEGLTKEFRGFVAVK